MKHVGILGGTRFIGYHLAYTLLEAGHHVTLFHRGLTPPPATLPAPALEICGDRNKPDTLKEFLSRPFDVLFDLSGYVPAHIQPFLSKPNQAKVGHYIFCSTSSVYTIPPPCPFAETASRTTEPHTYGGDKALIEDLLLAEWHTNHWPITIFRPQGVFGPFGPAQAQFVLARLSHSRPVLLDRKRAFKINFLYVRDLVSAFLLAMNSDRSHGKVYNVAGDAIVDQHQFVNLCAVASSIKARIRLLDDPRYRDLPVGIPWLGYDLVADNRLIQRELGLRFTPMNQGLSETWAWLQRTPQYLEPELLRGEAFPPSNRPIPLWVKIWWAFDDLTASSTIRRRVRPLCTRLLPSSINRLWMKFKNACGE